MQDDSDTDCLVNSNRNVGRKSSVSRSVLGTFKRKGLSRVVVFPATANDFDTKWRSNKLFKTWLVFVLVALCSVVVNRGNKRGGLLGIAYLLQCQISFSERKMGQKEKEEKGNDVKRSKKKKRDLKDLGKKKNIQQRVFAGRHRPNY